MQHRCSIREEQAIEDIFCLPILLQQFYLIIYEREVMKYQNHQSRSDDFKCTKS